MITEQKQRTSQSLAKNMKADVYNVLLYSLYRKKNGITALGKYTDGCLFGLVGLCVRFISGDIFGLEELANLVFPFFLALACLLGDQFVIVQIGQNFLFPLLAVIVT